MANKVTFTLEAKTSGLKEANETAKSLNKNMTEAAASAKKLSNTKTAAAAYKAAQTAQESVDYGVTRSLRPGGTGASARDFAQEAQGLGGLVRLYATYAANIFAVGAAFRALSNAMDTSNMVRGLDQLGAASGTALGSLSKRLVEVTDGAISLREAMEATAKASSSGMSSENILRMGKVAKQASQALGVDMSDAVSRISRGITKLEPELLDEIGLFTKTGKAAEDYAKSVGKTANQLTDFERRAAFANAVLAEGEKKFGAINLDTNPYTQLLASIKDLSQKGLELINKVLGPIVKFFSESPAALTTAIAGLGAVLIKQALPALGEFKAGLQATADRATEISVSRARDAADAKKKIDQLALAELVDAADTRIDKMDEAEKRMQEIDRGSIRSRTLLAQVYADTSRDITTISDDEFKKFDNSLKKYASGASADPELVAREREQINVLREARDAEISTRQAMAETAIMRKEAEKGLGTYAQTLRISEAAQKSATKAQIVSNAAYNGSLVGTSDAMFLMREELKKSGLQLGKFEAATLSVRSRMAAFAGQVGTAMNALGMIGMVVGAAIGAFQLLNAWFSKNAKETAAFEKSLDSSESAIANIGRTLDFINKKPLLEQLSVESVNARTNAFKEVSDSVTGLTNNLLAADKAASGWDRFMDGFATIWDGDLASKFSKNMAGTLFGSLEKLGNAPEAEEARKKIAEILTIDPKFTEKSLASVLENTAKTAPDKLKKLEAALADIGKAAQVSAAKSTELQSAFTKLSDMRKDMEKKLMPTDDLTKYGQEMINSFQKLSIAMDDPKTKLNAIQQLSKEMLNTPGTTLSQVLGLQQVADDAAGAERATAKYNQSIRRAAELEAELADKIGKTAASYAARTGKVQRGGFGDDELKRLRSIAAEIKSLKADANIQLNLKTELSGKVEAASGKIAEAQLAVFKEGTRIVTTALSAEWAKAGTTIANAYASILSGTETGIKMRATADRAVISAQIEQIKTQRDLIISNRELTLQIAEQELNEKKREAKRGGAEGAFATEEEALKRMREDLAAARSGKVKGLTSNLSKDLDKLESGMSKVRVDGIAFASSMESTGAAIANLSAQIAAISIGEKAALVSLEFKQKADALQVEIKSLDIQKQRADILKESLGDTNSAYIASKQELDASILLTQQKAELLAIEGKIAEFKVTGKAGDPEVKKLEAQKATLLNQQGIVRSNQVEAQAVERINAFYKEREKTIDRNHEASKTRLALDEETLNSAEKYNNVLVEIGTFSDYLGKSLANRVAYEKAGNKFAQDSLDLELERDKALNDIERRRKAILEIASGREDGATLEEDNALKQLDADAKRINTTFETRLGTLGRIKTEDQAILDVQSQMLYEQEQWNQLMAQTNTLADALKGTFGEIGEAIGGALVALQSYAQTQAQNAKQEQSIRDELLKESQKATPNQERMLELEEDLSKVRKKSAQDEVKGIGDIAGSAKKMFKEKTAGYKILNAVEKASHAVRLVMAAKELAQNIANNAAKIASDGPAIMAEFFKQMGPWGWAAGAAAIAAIGGSFSGGGGTPVGMTAEEQQNVQGTGQDYVNGKLVNNGGGVLGDLTARSEDILNSIQIIEDNSTETILFDSKALDALRAIETNTKGLAGKLYGVQGLTGGMSGFGTTEKSNPGFLGLFASSTKIIDTGIRAVGTLGDIIANPEKFFQQYETVQKTKSGFLGIGGGTSTRVNTKPLEAQITEYVVSIFTNAKTAVVELGKVFGMDTTEAVDDLVKNLSVDFQVSAKDLSGDELIEAIMAETGVTMNQLVAQVYPFLEQFQQVGEGMFTTLTRVNTEIAVVNGMFAQMGVDFATSFTTGFGEIDTAATRAAEEASSAAKKVLDAALEATKVAGENDYTISSNGEVETRTPVLATEAELEAVNEATRKYNEALANEHKLKYVNISASIAVYDALVKSEGGLEKFTERAQFFLDNFVPETTKLAATTTVVKDKMAELGYASVDTREEFYNLVTGLDLSTESGRATYSALMDVAPAFDIVAAAAEKALEDMQKTAGLTAESLTSIIVDGYMNGVDGAQIGKMVANTIQRGVEKAMLQGVAGQISTLIMSQIVNPMLQSIIAGGTVSAAVSTATMNTVVNQARTMLNALAEVFNSPEFKQFMEDIGNLNFNFPSINVTPAYEYTNDNSTDNESDKEDFSAIDSAFNALKKAIDAEKKILQEQLETAKDNLDKLKQVYDTLTDNIRDLRNSVDSTAALSAIQGQQYLNSILTSGVIGDPDKVSEAIEAVRGQLENTAFASKFEEDRAKLILAGQLDAIKDLTGEQMTEAEQTIAALEEQISQLDLILEQTQAQVDAIKGVDNSVLSVTEALAKLESALLAGPGTQNPAPGPAPGPGPVITRPGMETLPFTGRTTKSITGEYFTGTASNTGSGYTYSSYLSDSGGFAAGPGQSYSVSGSRPWTASSYAQKNSDVVNYYMQNKSQIAQLGQAATLAEYMLYHFITYGIKEGRQFAKGGIFDSGIVTAPTVFDASLMGEAGPEAIMPLGKLADGSLGVRGHSGDNAELVAEIRNLKAELTHMKQYVAKTSNSTEESRKLLDEVVRGGSAITVESEIASY